MKRLSNSRKALALLVITSVLAASPALAYKPSTTAAPTATTLRITSSSKATTPQLPYAPLLGQRARTAPPLFAEKGARPSAWRRLVNRAKRLVPKLRINVKGRAPVKLTAEQAAAKIQAGQHVFIPLGHQTAHTVLKALNDRAKAPNGGLSDQHPVRLIGLSNTASTKLFATNTKIVADSLFIGGNTRDSVNAGRGDFRPGVFLSRIPRMIREKTLPVDVALVQVSPPDSRGYVTLGTTAGATLAAMKTAKVVIAEVNPNVPRTSGATRIHQSKLNYVVETNKPLTEVPRAKIGDTERKIASHIVGLIPKKNPTLQFGIGGVPDAVAEHLAKSGRKDLRVHSEMISDGVMKLVKAGAVKGKVRYTFAMGTTDFIKWMDKNKKLESKTADWTNDPARIASIPNFVAVNGAASVDLKGQVNAQYINKQWYSGHGGQVDFMTGAMHSKGGRAIIALPSSAQVKDPSKIGKGEVTFQHNGKTYVSRIKPRLGSNDVVTTSMGEVQYIVTEHGVAHIDGKTAYDRAMQLINVAHPAARAKLKAALDQEVATRRDIAQTRLDRGSQRNNNHANNTQPRTQTRTSTGDTQLSLFGENLR